MNEKLLNETMLKKFKKVEQNKSELDIQNIEVSPQGSEPGPRSGEKHAPVESKVSNVPGKDQILFFNSTFLFGQSKIEKDALTGIWPLGNDYVVVGYFNKGIYVQKIKTDVPGKDNKNQQTPTIEDFRKIADIGCSDILVDKFRRLIFTNAKNYHLMISSPIGNLPSGLTSQADFGQEQGPYESKDLDDVLKCTDKVEAVCAENLEKFKNLKSLDNSQLKKVAKFSNLSDSKGRNLSISPDGNFVALRSSN